MVYKDISWNEEDLIACKQAAGIIYREYGEEVLLQLEEEGCFGNLAMSDIFEE